MRLISPILILLFASTVVGQTPIDYNKWHIGGDQYSLRLGRIDNYPDTDSTFAVIENDWITLDDTLHTNRNAVLKTDVNDKGQSTITLTMGGNTYTVSQRLLKMVWINTATQNWTDIADVVWNTPAVDSNILHWQGIIPGVDYRVRKQNVSVEHGIFFKPAFLDAAIVLYNQRADSADIALGNVMAYTLTNVDNADSGIGTVDRRMLKQIGKYSFGLNRQYLRFPGSGDLPSIPVKQRWIKQGGNIYCVEYVMMSAIKAVHEALPSATIWHNASTIIEDDEFQVTYIYKYASETNYSTETTVQIANSEQPADVRVALLLPDLSAISAGANIDSVRLTLTTAFSGFSGYEYEAYPITTEWSEASPMAWDSASTTNNWAGGLGWTTSDFITPGDSANARSGTGDDIVWESGDGDGLAEATQNTLDGTAYGYVIYIEVGSSVTAAFNTEDHATASSRPEMYVEYTAAGGPTDDVYVRRRRQRSN